MATFKVGDRVKCVSKMSNAPVGIVGTVVEAYPENSIQYLMGAQYRVQWDYGQDAGVDEFPDSTTPEWDGELELLDVTAN